MTAPAWTMPARASWASIARMSREIAGSKAFIGDGVKLAVLPEYASDRLSDGRGRQSSLARQGRLSTLKARNMPRWPELAVKHQLYLGGNAYETDPHFQSSTSRPAS